MSVKKKGDEKKLQQVRMMLDNPFNQEPEEKDKYLVALQKRLTGSPDQLEFQYSSSKRDMDLTPHVVVHRKKQDFVEKKASVDMAVVKQNYRVDFADEDLFEIERLVDEIPEFVEVQPEGAQEDESVPQFEEVEEEQEDLEDLPKWEPVLEKDQKQVDEVEIKKTIKKFEPVKTVDETKKEETEPEEIEKKRDEDNKVNAEESNMEVWDESDSELSSAEKSGSGVWEPINNKKEKIKLKKRAEIFKVFASVNHINQDTAVLLYDQGIKTIDELKQTSLESLKDIDGISVEQAERIFYEVNKDQENKSSDVLESKEKHSSKKTVNKKPYRHGAYALYKKEISIGNDNTRVVRFFSKEPPEDSQPSPLPSGYEVKINRKTGVPFIKKIR